MPAILGVQYRFRSALGTGPKNGSLHHVVGVVASLDQLDVPIKGIQLLFGKVIAVHLNEPERLESVPEFDIVVPGRFS